MPTIQEVRAKYPQYNDMPDGDLADALHGKYYSDMDKGEFYQKIGLSNPISKLESYGSGLEDMASFGLDDELRGTGRAIGNKIKGNPMTISQGIDQVRNEREADKTANPNSYLGGQVTGAIAPAILTRGKSLADMLPAATNSLVKSAAQAAPSAVAYGVGSGDGLSDRLVKGGEYGLGAATLGAGLPLVPAVGKAIGKTVQGGSKNIVSGIKARAPEELDEVAKSMAADASALYTKSKNLGAVLNKNRAVSIYNKMNQAVTSAGKTNPKLHGDTLSVLDDVKSAVQSDNPFSLEELDQYRQLLDDVITKNTDVAGKLNPDAFRAVQAKNALDDSVRGLNKIDIVGGKTEAVDALLEGRAKWAQKSKYESVTRELRKAGGDPAKIKSRLERFVNDPRKMRGFTQEEKDSLIAASRNSMNEKILKGLGRFGIEPNNVFLPLVTGGLTTMAGATGFGAPLVAAGTVARQANKFVARGKAENALKMIESRK